MPVCGYVLVPEARGRAVLMNRLSCLAGCEVVPAQNSDVLLLVTTTPGPTEDRELRQRIESLPGLDALLLTFGEIDPDTKVGDPLREDRRRRPPGPLSDESARQGPQDRSFTHGEKSG
jgi:hypothetical protein